MFGSLNGQKFLLRFTLISTLCTALLLPSFPLIVGKAAQDQSAARAERPRPGKPEGEFPDLTEIKNEAETTPEPAPPIPSTIRSPKNPLRPWNGRRVGESNLQGEVGQALKLRRRAHASRRAITFNPPAGLDNQYIANFFNWALLRVPSGSESTYWNDQLRVAYAQGQPSLKLAALELGKTLFESAEYAARQRNDHWYVYDLYKTYLMRDPDATGWANWESQVPDIGRENVRRAFEESAEFANLIASIVPEAGLKPANLTAATYAAYKQR